MKADKDSANLAKLQQASRGVNQATAGVVASTKSGKSQIEEKGEHGAAGLAGSTDLPPDLHSLRPRCWPYPRAQWFLPAAWELLGRAGHTGERPPRGHGVFVSADSMDFSSMTLTQIKRQEMDSQVGASSAPSETQPTLHLACLG